MAMKLKVTWTPYKKHKILGRSDLCGSFAKTKIDQKCYIHSNHDFLFFHSQFEGIFQNSISSFVISTW